MRIYLCPAFMDWIVFLLLFAVTYGAGERHMTMLQCAWLGGTFQIVYLLSSLLVGRILTRRNARALLLISTAATTGLGVVCLVAIHFWPLFVTLSVLGLFVAIFFNAFQTFMRGESAPGGLGRSVGAYTLAWSSGASVGFMSSGYFYNFGAWALSGLNVLIGAIVFIILYRHRTKPDSEPSADEHIEHGTEADRPVNTVYVLVGWLIIFTATFVQRPVQTFFPAISAKAGVSSLLASLPLFLHMGIQAVVGFGMMRQRRWLYRRTPLVLIQGLAAASFLAIWRWPSFQTSAIGISLLGLYTGFAYFSAVYYASNSGRRSWNIGINEFLVGLGSFTSLFAVQRWISFSGNEAGMYLVCGTALGISVLLQFLIASSKPAGTTR